MMNADLSCRVSVSESSRWTECSRCVTDRPQRLLSASAYRPTLHKSTGTASQLAKTKKKPAASLLSSATPIWLSKAQLEALGPLLFNAKTDDLHIEVSTSVQTALSTFAAVPYHGS